MGEIHRKARDEEINLVKKLNKLGTRILKNLFSIEEDIPYIYAVHAEVSRKSNIHSKPVRPKADVFLVASRQKLKLSDFYLSDREIEGRSGINPIAFTGISVKFAVSKSYTIVKMSPDTLEKLKIGRELGAAASLYDKKMEDFKKNKQVLDGWGVKVTQLENFLKQIGILDLNEKLDLFNQTLLKKIKRSASKKIKQMINDSEDLKQKLFWGIGIFPEPYSARYFYYRGRLAKVESVFFDFSVTTGSGRSKGDFTLVLKPSGKVQLGEYKELENFTS